MSENSEPRSNPQNQNQALQAPSSKSKSNLRFIIASIVASIIGLLTPLTFFILIGIFLAGFAIYRSHRSKGGWIALVLGVMLYLLEFALYYLLPVWILMVAIMVAAVLLVIAFYVVRRENPRSV